MLDENTAAVLINTPNNPSGAAYSAETLTGLADRLRAASAKYGHRIFLISDEPYREIMFGGQPIQYAAKFYDDTLTCYSFSKSLSLPGERIGYVAANPRCEDAEYIVPMCGQISRGTGHNCPASLIQLAVAECLDETSDLGVYETNMELIYAELKKLGFTVVKPSGTFYVFPKALEEDANAFCKKAMKYDLALVPGDSFGCPATSAWRTALIPRRSAAALPHWKNLWRKNTGNEFRSGRARPQWEAKPETYDFDTINGRSAQCRNKNVRRRDPSAALHPLPGAAICSAAALFHANRTAACMP